MLKFIGTIAILLIILYFVNIELFHQSTTMIEHTLNQVNDLIKK